ncbi:MAG: ATP-binding protein [Bacteroidota bacterium]
MAFRNFRFYVTCRILLLLALGYGAMYVATQTYFWLVSFWLALLVILLTVELIRYVERNERSLAQFLLSIRQNDFTHSFASLSAKSAAVTGRPASQADHLQEAYQQIMLVFRKLRDEKETQYQYLQTVVEHVNVALLCFDDKGEIKLMNAAAKLLLRRPTLKNLHSLDKIDPQLREAFGHMQAGKPALVKLEIEHRLVNLSMQASEFKLLGEKYTLLSLQDIRYELEAQEVEAWQKLIRVLTHEIMNSVIPISTLTSVVCEMLVNEQGQLLDLSALDSEEASDLQGSLRTIESRSKGLVSFVKAYKSITQLPEPRLTTVSLQELFQRVHTLLKSATSRQGITFECIAPPPDLHLKADLELVEQVLINLVRNAMDALANQPSPQITLHAGRNAHRQIYIQVRDNGLGIDAEVLPQIFIPFFTTKPEGTGVGLSLSRQIMLLHRGNITVHSKAGEGSTFTLVF